MHHFAIIHLPIISFAPTDSRMNTGSFFTGHVTAFTQWLADRLGTVPVHFAAPGASSYMYLHDALIAYRWPRKLSNPLPTSVAGVPYRHPLLSPLPANSNFTANAVHLGILQVALKTAYAAGPASSGNQLSGAVAAIFHWGGVYTKRGNGAWLCANHPQLHTVLTTFATDHARGSDTSTITNLRFNSGMTKVYSLMLPDFIIYDSRVAAALAWLALDWWTRSACQPAGTLPDELKFGCPAANGKMAAFRNPATAVFPRLNNDPHRHYTWNVRANWILSHAHHLAGPGSHFSTLREIEAALFQMGNKVC